ncbi:MAG TPA: SET domain-containing protein [Cytophagaceae bacterium]
MLLVKTRIGQSTIEGIGLFADEFIPKGTVIWELTKGIDQLFDQGTMEVLKKARGFDSVGKYLFKSKVSGSYILCADDARFMNHTKYANTYSGPEDDAPTIALRDIHPGEEITCDYSTFDDNFETYTFTK